MAKKKPRWAWQLLLRWKRGEIDSLQNVPIRTAPYTLEELRRFQTKPPTKSELGPTLRDYFTFAELRRIEARRTKARERLQRLRWLRAKIEEAEAVIVAAGLPRDAWRALILQDTTTQAITWDSFILKPDVDPFADTPIVFQRWRDARGEVVDPEIYRFVKMWNAAPDTWRVYWSACIAAAAVRSLQETWPVRQWTLARVIEAFEAKRRATEQHDLKAYIRERAEIAAAGRWPDSEKARAVAVELHKEGLTAGQIRIHPRFVDAYGEHDDNPQSLERKIRRWIK